MALLGVGVVLGAIFYAKAVPKIERYVDVKLERFGPPKPPPPSSSTEKEALNTHLNATP